MKNKMFGKRGFQVFHQYPLWHQSKRMIQMTLEMTPTAGYLVESKSDIPWWPPNFDGTYACWCSTLAASHFLTRVKKSKKVILPQDFAPLLYSVIMGMKRVWRKLPGNKHFQQVCRYHMGERYATAKGGQERSDVISDICPMGAFIWFPAGLLFQARRCVCSQEVSCRPTRSDAWILSSGREDQEWMLS